MSHAFKKVIEKFLGLGRSVCDFPLPQHFRGCAAPHFFGAEILAPDSSSYTGSVGDKKGHPIVEKNPGSICAVDLDLHNVKACAKLEVLQSFGELSQCSRIEKLTQLFALLLAL